MGTNWKYYNHAIIPTTEPHETAVFPQKPWSIPGGTILLARWTTDFDCGYETKWWYVIKDTPLDISTLKSKRRYEINKGKKNFEVKRICASQYAEQLLEVVIEAYKGWPEKYRPAVDHEGFINEVKGWKDDIVYGGFDRETGELVAYSYLTEYPGHLEFSVLRAKPECERNGVNAAMVAAIVEDYNDRLGPDFYINDGARSIRHETAFQDYLEKYFEFRKAYCKLEIKYRFPIGLAVRILYPFRKKINRESSLGSMIAGVLQMEEYRR